MVILCTIGLETRELSLPSGQVIASYDHNVDVIRFQVETIPGFSLDTSSIRIAAQGPNKARHDYAVDPSTVSIEEETGYITFDWPIPAGVTEMPIGTFKYGDKGNLIFAVCAEIIDGSTVSKAWHSDDGIITVVAHLEPEAGGGEDPEEEATNRQMIGQLQTDVAVINTQIGALANGSPTPVETKAEMTEESAVYLYVGDEEGESTGYWYSYDSTEEDFVPRGEYGGAAVTDTTLELPNVPADSETVGLALAEKADSNDVTAVDARVAALNTELSIIGDSGEMYLKDFVQGNLDNNGELVSHTYFITTGNFHKYPYPIIFTPTDGYRYSVYWYNNGTYVNRVQMISVKKYCLPANTQFKLVIARTTSATLTPAEGFNKVSIKGYAGYYGWHNSNEIENLKNGRCLLPMLFNNGSDVSGTYASYVNYRVVNVDFIRFDKDTVIVAKDGYKFALHGFSDEGVYQTDSDWKTRYTASANTNYRILIAKTTEDTSSIADLEEFYTAIHMVTPLGETLEVVNPFEFGFIQSGRAKLVAHSGYLNGNPENTIPAFEAAGRLGYWGMEADVNQTSDGHYVMIHDTTVDRTTNGTGSVSSMTLAEIRALHIKDHDDMVVPTFEEYLAICKHYGLVPVIELKATITNTKESYETIIGIVDDYGLKDRCMFIGSKWAVANFKKASSKIPFIPVYQTANNYDFDTEYNNVKNLSSVGMAWEFSQGVSMAQAKKLHGNKMIFGTFTINNISDVNAAFSAGVDFVITNNVLPTE